MAPTRGVLSTGEIRRGDLRYETIHVKKSTPMIGAEVLGIDLLARLSNRQVQDLHNAFTENLVIFFRDQKMDHQQQKDFARRFGQLHTHPAAPQVNPEHPEIFGVSTDENSKHIAGEHWHSDVSCDAEPPMGSILYLRDVPLNGGGDTMFANMYRAYETLSAPIRRLLDDMTAIHDGEQVYRGRYGGGDKNRKFPRAEHPVVRTHPVTKRKCLFVNRTFTTRIVGVHKNESDAILEMLYRHIETPEFSTRFKWESDSVAFWDNRCVQHRAIWDYHPNRRYGFRVTICGDKPY
jgi:taurine dioxygenase